MSASHRGCDGVDASPTALGVPEWWVLVTTEQEASVSEVSTIGLDLAKRVFQAHGADASGKVVFRKRLQPRGREYRSGAQGRRSEGAALFGLGHWPTGNGRSPLARQSRSSNGRTSAAV